MTYYEEQIAIQKNVITQLTAAITALSTNGVSRYVLDTGQSRQDVTRLDLSSLTAQRQSALIFLADLERAAGITPSVVYVQPEF